MVTELDKREISLPWPMDWGYWYSWALVITFQALLFAPCVPLVAPLAAVTFYLKYEVEERHGLSRVPLVAPLAAVTFYLKYEDRHGNVTACLGCRSWHPWRP